MVVSRPERAAEPPGANPGRASVQMGPNLTRQPQQPPRAGSENPGDPQQGRSTPGDWNPTRESRKREEAFLNEDEIKSKLSYQSRFEADPSFFHKYNRTHTTGLAPWGESPERTNFSSKDLDEHARKTLQYPRLDPPQRRPQKKHPSQQLLRSTDLNDPAADLKLKGFVEFKRRQHLCRLLSPAPHLEPWTEFRVVPQALNVFPHLDPTGIVSEGFVRDLFEIVSWRPGQDLGSPPAGSRNLRLDDLRQELHTFVKGHAKCGEVCPHLQKFYERIGFLKALEKFRNKKALKMPVVKIGEDRISQKLLKDMCGGNKIKWWTIKSVQPKPAIL